MRRPHTDLSAGLTGADDRTAATWMHRRYVTPEAPGHLPFHIRVHDLHLAFPAGQTGGTRLVLTQATYQLQRWLDWLDAHPGITAEGDLSAATPAQAREAFAARGPWARIAVEPVPVRTPDDGDLDPDDPLAPLRAAFEQPDPEERWRCARRLAFDFPSQPALHLAFASACMELQRLDDAHAAIERALALSPDWEAAHFEQGKLWLRLDDTPKAAAAFAEAGRLMPSFSAAFSNLGAALGELERPEEALAALEQALRFDPHGHAILNNIGATSRDLGRLDEAESALKEAVARAPHFAFAHYNLGHTLFLQGRFADARDAYEQGLAVDGQKSPRQRCRAALAHAATNDTARAAAYLVDAIEAAPEDQRAEMVNESVAVLTALAEVPGVLPAGIFRLIERLERI